uniref:F-box only protein 30 n=1 Tax=Timema bartmani TaxID=61472 RepID=A0A7R9I5U0_9NEOP|nr:unnamed protein product [Timema bartmani]
MSNICSKIVHPHCDTCIQLKKCSVLADGLSSCDIIMCTLKCGSRFHSCKSEEHSLLCPNEKVPCINAGNGCPAIMFRYKRARHLEVCPASVVVCTMEWSRPWMCTHDFKLNPCRTFNSSHKHQLDIALALQDRRMWNKWKEIPAIQSQLGIMCGNIGHNEENYTESINDPENKSNTKKIWTSINPCYDKKRECTLTDSMIEEGSSKNSNVNQIITSNGESSNTIFDSDHLLDNFSPLDTCNVKFVERVEVTDVFTSKRVLNTVLISSNPSVVVNCAPDKVLHYRPLMKPICHFLCARPFRRDEYCWHYKNVHSDIHGGLNGWLEHRCPLAGEGCMYSLRRIHPCATEASVIHSDILESFGVTLQKECNNSNIKEIPKGESILQPNGGIITHPQVEFDHLPFEVLRYICRFIDSFSLCNLSLTSRRIRDVCHSLVKERGIMVQKWKRSAIDGEVHWTVSSQWTYTSHGPSSPLIEDTSIYQLLKPVPFLLPYFILMFCDPDLEHVTMEVLWRGWHEEMHHYRPSQDLADTLTDKFKTRLPVQIKVKTSIYPRHHAFGCTSLNRLPTKFPRSKPFLWQVTQKRNLRSKV